MTRRDEIMAYICRYAREHWGPSPSIREVAIEFGLNYTTVYRHIKRLIAEERLEMRDGKLMVVGANWFPPRPKQPYRPRFKVGDEFVLKRYDDTEMRYIVTAVDVETVLYTCQSFERNEAHEWGMRWVDSHAAPVLPLEMAVYGLRLDDFNRAMADLDERLARLASANGDSEKNEE